MRLRCYRPMAALLLALHLQACMSWQRTGVSPGQVIEEGSFRVTVADGTRLEVRNATIEDDSLRLHQWQRARLQPSLRADRLCRDIECPGGVPQPVTIALDDVQELETLHFSVTKTAVLLGVLGGLVAGLAAFSSSYRF